MTGADIITKFESLTGDTLDSVLEYQLANDAMHEIEEDIKPEGLKKVDTSDSTTVGQTYTTAVALPDDFFMPARFIYVGTDRYYQVPFDRAVDYRDSAGFYYVDTANSQYHLCGTQASVQTITFPYFATTADITADTSPVWPAQFHSLIPLRMAEMYFAIDQGEKQKTWDEHFGSYYQQRLARFREYDASLKLANIDSSAAPFRANFDNENKINSLS